MVVVLKIETLQDFVQVLTTLEDKFFSWHQSEKYNTLKFCLWKYTRAFALSTLSFRCRCSQGGKDQRNLNHEKINFWGCSCHRIYIVYILYWILIKIVQQIHFSKEAVHLDLRRWTKPLDTLNQATGPKGWLMVRRWAENMTKWNPNDPKQWKRPWNKIKVVDFRWLITKDVFMKSC